MLVLVSKGLYLVMISLWDDVHSLVITFSISPHNREHSNNLLLIQSSFKFSNLNLFFTLSRPNTDKASSQRHTLPIWDCMHSISEVIILNNDQHQHQKIISTNNKINCRIKRQHTTVANWCYCLR